MKDVKVFMTDRWCCVLTARVVPLGQSDDATYSSIKKLSQDSGLVYLKSLNERERDVP